MIKAITLTWLFWVFFQRVTKLDFSKKKKNFKIAGKDPEINLKNTKGQLQDRFWNRLLQSVIKHY
jgi:hypothetical protein